VTAKPCGRRAVRGACAGFTLIEILVTLFLIVVMLALVGYPVLTGMAYMEKGVARADALSAARLALDAMTRELAEAMYVFDPPADGGFVAFLPTVSSSQGAAPIEPQAAAVRYWRALRDPRSAYAPFYQPDADPVNPYYLARTEIPDPTRRDDPWNDSGEALPRAAFWYADGYSYNGTWPTAQPGYPWLEAVSLYPVPPDSNQQQRRRWYGERAVGLTPDDWDYDVPVASFSPEPVTEEALLPAVGGFPRDYSRYRARYPLWVNFAQWDPAAAAFREMGRIKIYAGSPRVLAYQTAVDSANGEVWVEDAVGTPLYDLASYPLRDVNDPGPAQFAFGVDYDRGQVQFDFPANDVAVASALDMYIYELPRVRATTDLDPDPARDSRRLVAGSVTVWVETSGGEITYYQQVDPMPATPASIGPNHYAVDGIRIVFDSDGGEYPAATDTVHVRYRYRNNLGSQLVVASYATKAVINISLIVSKRDIAARTPPASRQDATLVAKVKLKNIPR